MKPIEFLPSEYGYVILCFVFGHLTHIYLAHEVMKAREKYNVPYPNMYSDKHHTYNCIQRSHLNFPEQYIYLFMMMLMVGMVYPKITAACGFLYLVSRFSYAFGYSTGDPELRENGLYGQLGSFTLVFLLLYVANLQAEFIELPKLL